MFVVPQLQTADLLFKNDHFIGTGSQTGSMVVPKRLYLLAEGHHFPFDHLCSAQTSFGLPSKILIDILDSLHLLPHRLQVVDLLSCHSVAFLVEESRMPYIFHFCSQRYIFTAQVLNFFR